MIPLVHLHFVQALDPLLGGGLGSAATGLHEAMISLGASSTLVSTAKTAEGPNSGTKLYHRVGPEKLFFAPRLVREAAGLVSDAHVVHGHGFYVAPNWIVGREARRQGRAMVYHPHGMLEPFILNRSRYRKRLVHVLFEDANFRSVKLWRALTSVEAEQIRSIRPTARIVVIPNGVALPEIDSRDSDKPVRRLAYLGRLHPKKGLETLFSAWSVVAPKFPTWELTVAGPGDPAYADVLHRAAAALPRVTMIPAVRGAAKETFFRESDLFVLPSFSEGLPMALLEGMAAALPVVVTRASNPPPVSSLGAGWICEPSIDSLADALDRSMSCDPIELAERGRIGRRHVEENYSWPQVSRALIEACGEVCP